MTKPEHPIYKRVSKEEADATAWVFTDKDTFEEYHYKHPELKEEDVRIKILSAGLCMSDSHTGREKWGPVKTKPIAPGHEIVGEVEAIGNKVTNVKVGDKVLMGPLRDACFKCDYCKKGWTNSCIGMDSEVRFIYNLYWGGYSTHCQHPQSHVIKLPENLDYKTIAPIMCAGITVFLPLSLHVQKGDRVAIIGIGGLGHYGIQFAKKMGCTVDVFTSSHTKDDLVKKLGADNVVIWTEGEHKKLSNTYDAILNTIPVSITQEQVHDLMNVIKPQGKWLQVGVPDVNAENIQVSYFDLVLKQISLIGSLVGGIEHHRQMLKFISEHGIESIVEHYDFEDFPKALDKLENGKPHFRCVVDVEKFHQKKN